MFTIIIILTVTLVCDTDFTPHIFFKLVKLCIYVCYDISD